MNTHLSQTMAGVPTSWPHVPGLTSSNPQPTSLLVNSSPTRQPASNPSPEADPLREVFDDFVGQTFYSQMLSAMRKTVDKPAYFHGGYAEEMFQAQLDQTLSERLADTTAEQFTGPMFELFNLGRR